MYPKVESSADFHLTHRFLKQLQRVLDEQQLSISEQYKNDRDLPHYIENDLLSVHFVVFPDKKVKLQVSYEVGQTLFTKYGNHHSRFQGSCVVYRNKVQEYSTYSSLLKDLKVGLRKLYEERILRHQEDKDGLDIPY